MTERTKPLAFVIEGVSLNVLEPGRQSTWAAEIRWDDEDGCFVLETGTVGNFDFAPVDLEELARILRAIPREAGQV